MNELDQKTESLSEQLDRLQEDSWQLELIVSGVVIFLLIGAFTPLSDISKQVAILQMGASLVATVASMFFTFLQLSYLLLVGMFLLHLSIRGVWIGAIGLRSVSGGFDYEELEFQPKFSRFLRKRLGDFDDYIARLERNASITFSLAFLLFFAILSVGLFFVAVILGVFIFTGPDGQVNAEDMAVGKWWFYTLIALVAFWCLLMVLAGLFYLVDFVTFGWLKRRRWLHRVYYPFYRLLGWITLARLYRPIYYNIIDNRFGKRLVGVYVLVAFLLTVATAFQLTPFTHFSYAIRKAGVIHPGNYVDEGTFDQSLDMNFRFPSLGSRFPTGDYQEVFVPSNSKYNKAILKKRFPDLRPLAPSSISFVGKIRLQDTPKEKIDSTLQALGAIHRVYLNDSLLTDVRWQFYQHPVREQPGLLYDLPVYDLARGEHWVRIEGQRFRSDSMYWQEMSTISFMR